MTPQISPDLPHRQAWGQDTPGLWLTGTCSTHQGLRRRREALSSWQRQAQAATSPAGLRPPEHHCLPHSAAGQPVESAVTRPMCCQSWKPCGLCMNLPLLFLKQGQLILLPRRQRTGEMTVACLPGNEDAEQIHLIRSCQEHDNTQSQLQEEESSHHSINSTAAAE